jgi:hypothetical protein
VSIRFRLSSGVVLLIKVFKVYFHLINYSMKKFVFISNLFTDDVSSSDYIASNAWKWSWPTLRLSPNIYLEGLRKKTRKIV